MMEKYIHASGAYSIYQPLTKEAMEKTAEDKSYKLDPKIVDLVRKIKPDNQKHIYNLLTALGSGEVWGPNSNADYWKEKWLKPETPRFGHKTFLDAGIFTHHKNKDKSKSLGEVLYATYNPVMFRVELIWRIDRDKAQQHQAEDYYDRLADGECLDVSMGCKVKHDVCMICGNCAPTRAQYCDHMRSTPNKILPDGRICCVDNPEPRFFDISIVRIGAARHAKIMGKAEEKPDGTICLGEVCTLPARDSDHAKVAMVISDAEMGVKHRREGDSYNDLIVNDILRDEKIKHKLDHQARASDMEAMRAYMRAGASVEDVPHQSIDNEVMQTLKEIAHIKVAGKVKRQTTFNGLTIKIEYDKGDIRKGKTWEKRMKCSYGYIPKTEGEDGEAVDVYLANEPSGDKAYVVRQLKHDGSYDEDKVMLGFTSWQDAKDAFFDHIPERYFGAMASTSIDSIKRRYLTGQDKIASKDDCECGCAGNCNTYNGDEVMKLLLDKVAARDPKSPTFDYSKSRFAKHDKPEDKKPVKTIKSSGGSMMAKFMNGPTEKQAESLDKILSIKSASQSKRGEIIKKIPALIEPISATRSGDNADQKLLSNTRQSNNED